MRTGTTSASRPIEEVLLHAELAPGRIVQLAPLLVPPPSPPEPDAFCIASSNGAPHPLPRRMLRLGTAGRGDSSRAHLAGKHEATKRQRTELRGLSSQSSCTDMVVSVRHLLDCFSA